MVLVGVWGGGRGWARLSSQESRRLARPLHSDSLPEYTQIREEATGGKKAEEKRPKVSHRGPEGNSCPLNSHTDPTLAHKMLEITPHRALYLTLKLMINRL